MLIDENINIIIKLMFYYRNQESINNFHGIHRDPH